MQDAAVGFAEAHLHLSRRSLLLDVETLLRAFDRESPRGSVPPGDITARELLARGALRARSELAEQPEQRGRILHTIGDAYLSLGLFSDAITLMPDRLEPTYMLQSSA